MTEKENNKSTPKIEKPENTKPTISEKGLPVTPQDYVTPPPTKPPKQDKKDK